MSKRIEKFIEQNRHLMDTENVPEAVWQKIQLPVAEKKRSLVIAWKPLYKWAAAAAVTALVAMTTYLLIEKYSHDIPEQGGGVAKSDTLPPGDIKQLAPEYAPQAEDIYNSIAVNKKELENIASTDPELYRQFAGDLATLDSSYRVLKSQAAASPNHDVIIKAMIQNLQLQAELLSRQLMIINQYKNSKKESHETKNTNQRI
ncbi:MAG: hypothetical protein U0V75_07555 [Ferruginibacter sp.]